MKATFTNINDINFDRFTLARSIDNTFIKSEINTDVNLYGDDHDYLFRERLKGADKEDGTITHECEDATFTKGCFISHNDGSFDLKRCKTTKKIKFENPLDCIMGVNDINIFDYLTSTTNTIQGELIRENTFKQISVFIDDEDYDLQYLIDQIGPINSRITQGFYTESIVITATAVFEDIVGIGEEYIEHRLNMRISYVKIIDTISHGQGWVTDPIDPTKFIYNPLLFPVNEWERTLIEQVKDSVKFYYNTRYEKGKPLLFSDFGISNTVDLKDVLIGLFSCTGKTLISNFLNINADATNPNNKYYDFSTKYCQNVKIVQSYDIIRESALDDSFGKSGLLQAKDLLSDIATFFNMVVVPDGANIRFEHTSYFQTKGIDLTLRDDVEVTPLESDFEEVNSELFLMAQPTTDNFYQVRIDYSTPDLYKEENEKKYQVKKLLTDVFNTINNEDFNSAEYESLFYLLSTDGENIISLNEQFSINSIVRNLHDINRPYKTGTIGNTSLSFSGFSVGLETEIKLLSSVLTWDKLFPLMSVKTIFGTFKIDSSEINEKGLLTLKCKK